MYFNIYIVFISTSFVNTIFMSIMLCGHLFISPIFPTTIFISKYLPHLYSNSGPLTGCRMWTQIYHIAAIPDCTDLMLSVCYQTGHFRMGDNEYTLKPVTGKAGRRKKRDAPELPEDAYVITREPIEDELLNFESDGGIRSVITILPYKQTCIVHCSKLIHANHVIALP